MLVVLLHASQMASSDLDGARKKASCCTLFEGITPRFKLFESGVDRLSWVVTVTGDKVIRYG